MRARHPRQSGLALIVVLWVMVILSSVALTYAYHTRLDVKMTGYQVQRVQARCLARAGVVRALAILRDDMLKDNDLLEDEDMVEVENDDKDFKYDAYAEAWYSNEEMLKNVEFGKDSFDGRVKGSFDVTITDAESRLNLSSARLTYESMRHLLLILGNEESDKIDMLAALIVDWRDPDPNPTVIENARDLGDQLSEDTYWNPDQDTSEVAELGPRFVLKNAPFDTMEEVLILLNRLELSPLILYGEDADGNGKLDDNEDDGDLSPPNDNKDGELLLGLMDVCTVEGSHSVNLNTLNRPCLEAVLFPFYGDDAEDIAEKMDEYRRGSDDDWGTRDDQFFREINNNDGDNMDLTLISGVDPQVASQLKSLGGVASSTFFIESTGRVGKVSYTVRATVSRRFVPEEQLGRDPLDRTKVVDLRELSAREKEQVRFIFEKYEDS